MRRSGLWWCVAVVAVARSVWGATYYVDFDAGDDARAGTDAGTAWKHSPGDANAVEAARAAAIGPGDVVLFKGGVVYRGSVQVPASGKAGSAVTYKGNGWGAEKAIIDGSSVVEGAWTRAASAQELRGNANFEKIYWCPAPKGYGFRTGTFEKREFLYPAQDPAPQDAFHHDRVDQLRVLPQKNPAVAQTDGSIRDDRFFTQSDPAFYDGASVMVWHQPNVTGTYKITGFDPATHTIRHEKVGGGGIYKDRDTYYAILNHPAYLSGPGQYWHDEKNGRLYVWPREGGKPAEGSVSIAGGEAGLVASGREHVKIEGFAVEKFVFGIRASGENTRDVEIRGNEVRNLKSNEKYAVDVSGTRIAVIDNRIINCQRAVGILVNGKDIVVKGNHVERTSRQGIWLMGTEHCQVVGNTVVDISGTHANGISVYLFSKDTLVAANRVLRTGSAFTYHGNKDRTPRAEGLYVVHNLFDGAANSWGSNMWDVVIVNNTFLGAANVGGDSGKQVFVNNIVHGGGNGSVRSHNLYTDFNWVQKKRDAKVWALKEGEIDWSGKEREKVFVDLRGGDYRLKEGSPALGAGIDATEHLPTGLFEDYDFSKDIEGQRWEGKPSMGAYGRGR